MDSPGLTPIRGGRRRIKVCDQFPENRESVGLCESGSRHANALIAELDNELVAQRHPFP